MTSPKEDQQPMTTREEALAKAAQDFIDKVDRGEARSVKSYAAFKAALRVASRQEVSVTVPRVTDNDRDEITVTLDGKELRGWSYSSDQERRTKMLCAREYVEGFCTGRQS